MSKSPHRVRRAWVLAIALLAVAGSAVADPRLDAIGAPKEPAYVYFNELADAKRLRFRRPKNEQVARPGARALVVREGLRYLWVIDAKGDVRIAPEQRDSRGVEVTGHPNLTRGGPARLAGVLEIKGGVAVLDSDSGRFGYMDSTMTAKNLEAAAAWIAQVQLVDGAGTKLGIRTRFVPPITQKRHLSARDKVDLSRARHVGRYGGYLLLPPRSGKKSELPANLRSTSARLAWAKRARTRWRRKSARRKQRTAAGRVRRGR